MPAGTQPRFAKSYAANVVLVIVTLFPGLINTSAIALAAPAIGGDVHAASGAVMALPLLNDAALAFGCVLGAEATRRFDGRALYFVLLAASLLTSLASALAPNYPVLLAAHVVHGLAAGMLFIVTLPPLLTTFGTAKLGATATVLVPALFGAATLGPVIGGAIAAPVVWRTIFAVEVVVAIGAMLLASQTLAAREPSDPGKPVDWFALATAATASTLLYLGVGALAGNEWTNPWASGPAAAGIVLYVVLLVGEDRLREPLVPVRKLTSSLALVGALATVVGSASFTALQQAFQLSLLRVDGHSPLQTGVALWPEIVAALAAGVLFGRIVTTKWVVLAGASGLALLALCALAARAIGEADRTSVGWLALTAGLGSGLSVTPGLFLVVLSFERAMAARAIALLNLFRLTGGFISAPGVEHTIGSRAQDALTASGTPASAATERLVRDFTVGRPLPANAPAGALRHALAHGIADAYVIVLLLALAGIVAIAAILLAFHVPLRTPDLQAFDEGKPALTPPESALA